MKVGETKPAEVSGLPTEPRMAGFSYSPDQTKMAFTNTTDSGVELWMLDIPAASAKKITGAILNDNIGRSFYWFTDNQNLLVKILPDDKKPLINKTEAIPTGPRVSVSEGKKAKNRTYQDLLQDKADEFNFEQLVRSKISKIDINGNQSLWKETDMYTRFNFSPNGEYVLVTTIQKPFSYIVPWGRFPSKTIIYDQAGNEVRTLLETPLREDMPQGFMATQKGMRGVNWRADKPAAIYYMEALDEGDPANETDFRDAVYELEAPFSGQPRLMLKTIQRFAGIVWGNDQVAIASDQWWNTRNSKTYLFNPSDSGIKPEILFDRNYQDNYANPGSFVTGKNEWGENTLVIDKNNLYLTGTGHSPEGPRPFFRTFSLKTRTTTGLWRADGKETFENIVKVLDPKKGILLPRVEAANVFPNYFIRNTIKRVAPQQITFFENPYQSLQQVHKELITYRRSDGIELSETLYLPAG